MTETSTYETRQDGDLPPMFWPAMAALALPTILGVIILYFALGPANFGKPPYLFETLYIPIGLCFVFGTPLVAWLSCRELRKKAQIKCVDIVQFTEVWLVAVKYSFFVHWLSFLALISAIGLFMDQDKLETFLSLLIIGGMINVFLFLLITVPVSLFCTAIFVKFYTLPPKKLAS